MGVGTTGEGAGEGAVTPPQKKKIDFWSQYGGFGTLVHSGWYFFTVQVYFTRYYIQLFYLFYTQNRSSNAIGV